MICIGLAGWGDHDGLYEKGAVKPEDKLKVYSRHFSVVEVDSSFYAVLQEKTFSRWVNETAQDFSFIVKAYQGMTGHLRGKNPFTDDDSMYKAFCESIRPVKESGKLKAVLFQYPPWFDCSRSNVDILRGVRERMKNYPVALEFRNQSWFTEETREKTLAFMHREQWVHSICDEPQAGIGSVPAVLVPTSPRQTIVRMHGRNASGWNQNGNPNWRATRYLYRYNEQELTEWRDNLLRLSEQTEELYVIFNNNSGGDAAENAKELMKLLGMNPEGLAPRQLELFE
ncbi:DUF72 domain-containing protein [Paenibacillus radicis (ex Xue et al. 2023)]|uniref:DUF72 domain-containing protein n=1 Tax=Paenibacillus radicis (ex Xue et al. 2023) TaxID=2972489 RepID=A0ABT1YGJ2_9BACL|nr:DUF72 domain-containing protein [Paenibacillus radicis (ex Xue et al. 2023)]MCR8632312.1 DUF72 domain-containing protein [Paenibacillus radicis (ex Xue et al. 2023)]